MTKKTVSSQKNPKSLRIQIIVALIGAAATIIAAVIFLISNFIDKPSKTPTPSSVIFTELSAASSPTSTKECKSPGASNSFNVEQYYKPKQYMGDTGDIKKVAGGTPNPIQFEYTTNGDGPHQWENKYINMESNLNPAQFAGIMFIDSAGPGGTDPSNGYDLRGYRSIKWEARSAEDDIDVEVEFVIGGVVWNWDEQTKRIIPAPYPDSIKSTISMGKHTLTPEWKVFEFVIQNKLEENSFQCVVGAFGWVITWGDNEVNWVLNDDGVSVAENPKTFEIEIRNIRYEK